MLPCQLPLNNVPFFMSFCFFGKKRRGEINAKQQAYDWV